MKTSTTSAELPCTPDAFWASFFDESYLRALYLDELESRAFDVLEPISDTSMHGTARIQTSGDAHCRRTDTFSIESKIFGLGVGPRLHWGKAFFEVLFFFNRWHSQSKGGEPWKPSRRASSSTRRLRRYSSTSMTQ